MDTVSSSVQLYYQEACSEVKISEVCFIQHTADLSTAGILLKAIITVNQRSTYGAVAEWCYSKCTDDSVYLNENCDISTKLVTRHASTKPLIRVIEHGKTPCSQSIKEPLQLDSQYHLAKNDY